MALAPSGYAYNNGETSAIDLELALGVKLHETNCFHCGEGYLIQDRPVYWVGLAGVIALHQFCFLEWWDKGLRADVERIRAEWATSTDEE